MRPVLQLAFSVKIQHNAFNVRLDSVIINHQINVIAVAQLAMNAIILRAVLNAQEAIGKKNNN